MNKQAIKDFSKRARKKLIEDVEQRAYKLGIDKDKILDIESFEGGFKIKGRESGIFTEKEKKHRDNLIKEIDKKGYEQVMEEVAYIWFNRFIALRFMEVNNYLPSGIRVLSSEEKGKTDPDILTEMSLLDLDIDWNKIENIENSNRDSNQKAEEIYKHLLIKQCNQLGSIMPTVFEEISDYTELLIPDNLLFGENSIVKDLVESIEEYDWKIKLNEEESELEDEKGEHGIEIIGWLYQYYILEKKDEVFAGLKKNIKISKENIPAATQLFTPKWIVKYMVENSLGRLWIESHPDDELKSKWKYYLEEAEQDEKVKEELEKLKNPDLIPEDIKILDPAMGSGHILVYAFDVLYDIYLSQGYSERQIPRLILENNLYGLDIDDRAGQLAVFALMMKARSKNRRIFRRKLDLNLVSIQESNDISKETINYFAGEDEELKKDVEYLIEVFEDAKEYGSILEVKPVDFDKIEERLEEIEEEQAKMYEQGYRNIILEKLPPLIKQGKIMSRKYDVVCTNPPYMGNRGMNGKLKKYLDENYKDSKSDLFAGFIERNSKYAKPNGHLGYMTPFVWMFISSYEKLRKNMIKENTITSLIQLEYSGFAEATVPICTFTLRNTNTGETGEYIKLSDFKGAENQSIKTREAIENPNVDYRYTTNSYNFLNIPGSPIAYWISKKVINSYVEGISLKEFASPKTGMTTANNDRFLRMWFEVLPNKIIIDCKNKEEALESKAKWFPYSKGGGFRRWKGFDEYVVNWENDGYEIKNYKNSKGKKLASVRSEDKYFKPCITWSAVTSYKFSSRIVEYGRIFDSGGSSIFLSKDIYFFEGLLNTKLTQIFLSISNATLNYQPRDIANIPVILPKDKRIKIEIEKIVQQNISISKTDWDSFETSWDFKRHPILTHKGEATTIESAFNNWADFAERQFYQLKENEEELNRIFIEIYGLEDELTPDVDEKDVTVNKADIERDIKSFISYAVGCMLGRYSLDVDGLIYAGGDWEDKWRFEDGKCLVKDEENNTWIESSFWPTMTNIIPITDDNYFEDDIVERFVEFVKITFGSKNLEQNLDYIADVLGKKARETSRDTIRRYFLKNFYKDHVKVYKKRPIYWLFDSGKQDGFKALIYMHRYSPDIIAEVRVDYLHKLQKKYEGEIEHLNMVIDSDISTREKNMAKKRKEKLMKQINECKEYDQAVNHMANKRIDIDLDDGVKVNHEKFQKVEVPRGEEHKPLKINLLTKI
ncbi:BREX-1 system adenine-specific DNA-methyltransferase PglX [Anaerosalibacter bizertensis]|uniref:site-specific DNA-methyltransferase (adenine-specific) n=1 Tax=Anaerosalibacter bizertensis TaxID=932217 RepID=A0A9Q4ADF0_9FIRM|nr:BREX-1 system adenine-specific DNA-methyltransferase PglX [Anaerosalibacter bizertensis]MBV1819081.1 BREX-1 system adenine-specific DNA-methyltransferase PglX [Bacteroidales bacterium MSK.15.36]MCB5559416.1 BREX-1 system adenine-specific DNA-methyltransferase PglX [Anaerosalibacter bizertensis]MCG4565364.1 BREX-1 system adenine-specific DNA-methyltransferase PglX [Anaerosalibacter bizertensis]MCG4582447.1 BREX-1 system adenine-specific DNA-methyltransferase PglX [Anaerosalibacter bizertensis